MPGDIMFSEGVGGPSTLMTMNGAEIARIEPALFSVVSAADVATASFSMGSEPLEAVQPGARFVFLIRTSDGNVFKLDPGATLFAGVHGFDYELL